MAWLWLILHDLACIAGMVYLVDHDHPWWALALLVMLAGAKVRERGGK